MTSESRHVNATDEAKRQAIDLLMDAIKVSVYALDSSNPLVIDAKKRLPLNVAKDEFQKEYPTIAPIKTPANLRNRSHAEKWIAICENIGLDRLLFLTKGIYLFADALKPLNNTQVQISHTIDGKDSTVVDGCQYIDVFYINASTEPPSLHLLLIYVGE